MSIFNNNDETGIKKLKENILAQQNLEEINHKDNQSKNKNKNSNNSQGKRKKKTQNHGSRKENDNNNIEEFFF